MEEGRKEGREGGREGWRKVGRKEGVWGRGCARLGWYISCK